MRKSLMKWVVMTTLLLTIATPAVAGPDDHGPAKVQITIQSQNPVPPR